MYFESHLESVASPATVKVYTKTLVGSRFCFWGKGTQGTKAGETSHQFPLLVHYLVRVLTRLQGDVVARVRCIGTDDTEERQEEREGADSAFLILYRAGVLLMVLVALWVGGVLLISLCILALWMLVQAVTGA